MWILQMVNDSQQKPVWSNSKSPKVVTALAPHNRRDHRDDVKLFKFWTFWYHFYDQFKECKQWKFVVKSFFKITEIYWPLISQIQCKWGGLINISFIVSFRPPRHFFLHFFFGIFLLLIVIVWQINKYKYKCVHDRNKIPPFLVPLNSYTQHLQLSTEHMKISTAVLEIHVNVKKS